MRFAVDTGGTFTDLVVENDDGACRLFKVKTTPDDPISGVLDSLILAADAMELPLTELLAKGDVLIHGTTHALNALVTGRTAKTAFITTKGHGDMLYMREGGRANAFDFTRPYPEPFVPRSLTFEIDGRVRPDGSIVRALDEDGAHSVLQDIRDRGIEAIAVCFLWSIVNDSHEERIGAMIESELPGIPYTLSHRLNPAIREFRRASSTAVDASLKPIMGDYMRSLETRLREAGFEGRTLVVTSQGGVIDAADAAETPVRIVNSGPSMAPVAGRFFAARDSALNDAIVADTGGTTYDVSIVRGGTIPTTRETVIGEQHRGIVIGFPWIDVKSVGAGGGSIAHVDSGGLLRVGPQSAGAVPGPVSYGAGGEEPTVTDASLVLGHIDPTFFLGGSMQLDRKLAESAIEEKVARPLGYSIDQAADAIITIATENMVQAILDITVKQGIDPRQAVLIGGGGAAGLNSVRIARRLGAPELIIPAVGPALSAAGALMSDLRADFHASHVMVTTDFDFASAHNVLQSLQEKCQRFAAGPGSDALETTISFKLDGRYATQVWEIEVDLADNRLETDTDVAAFVEAFHATHEGLFSFRDPDSPVEIIGWTATVSCRFRERPEMRLADSSDQTQLPGRRAYFSGLGTVETPVHHIETMSPGDRVDGPAILESAYTTVVVEPGASCEYRPSRSLLINVGADN